MKHSFADKYVPKCNLGTRGICLMAIWLWLFWVGFRTEDAENTEGKAE
jgi:hypothetical protein